MALVSVRIRGAWWLIVYVQCIFARGGSNMSFEEFKINSANRWKQVLSHEDLKVESALDVHFFVKIATAGN